MKRNEDFRDLAASLVNDKLKEYLDKRLLELQHDFKKQLSSLKSDLDASTDISLKASLEVGNLVRIFQVAFGGTNGVVPQIVAQPSTAQANPIPNQKISSPTPKVATKTAAEPKKGFREALSEITQLSQAAIEIANDKGIEPYARILLFMEEISRPVTVREMKRAGLVGSDDGSIELDAKLFEMEQRGWMAFNFKTDFWQITSVGREKLDSLENEGVFDSELDSSEPAFTREPDTTMVAKAPVPVMPAACSGPPVFFAEAPKPALTVVPREPRILAQAAPSPNPKKNLSIKDRIILHLSEFGPKTLNELRDDGIEGYGEQNSLASPMCKAKDDKLVANDKRGGKWYLTKKGEQWAERLAPTQPAKPTHNGDLRRQFAK